MERRKTSFASIAGAIGLSLGLAFSGTVFADDDEPEAYLYEGTCAELDAATEVDDITDLEDDDLSEIWEFIGNGQDQPDGLLGEEDDIDDVADSVQELIDGDYAVVVYENDSRDAAVITCGDIEGEVENDSLLIELDEVDGSGFEGRAFIYPDDKDDDDLELEFVVGIFPTGSVEPLETGTPAN